MKLSTERQVSVANAGQGEDCPRLPCLRVMSSFWRHPLRRELSFSDPYRSAKRVFNRVRNHLLPKRARCSSLCRELVSERIGLEIGGPSEAFSKKGILPVYPYVKSLDNSNFSAETIWQGKIERGMTFRYDKKKPLGNQYLSEATNLQSIPSKTYDLVLSSHVLEHVANPLLALSEWRRVLKEDGFLFLVIPRRDGTFDHRRPVTSLGHLIRDFEQQMAEGDLTHLSEILLLHDLERDPAAGTWEAFKKRSRRNLENRCLHHHVFDAELVAQVLAHMNLQVSLIEAVPPYHIVAIAQKTTSKNGFSLATCLGARKPIPSLKKYDEYIC